MTQACGYTLKWLGGVGEVPAAQWNALALPLATPFLEWEWLNHLESSGSVMARTGWLPRHLTLWRGQTLVAAAPLYLKGHSYGEFVFDHQWAELAYRVGEPYYPKLVGMTPFTPAVGYRFLVAAGETGVNELFLEAIDRFCQKEGVSSCHFLFADPEWSEAMAALGCHRWLHHHYLWQNHHYQSFEDYLAHFNANQRRNIKRERQAVQKAGLHMHTFHGAEIPNHFFSIMYDLYSNTCDRFLWGSKYLNRKFFQGLQRDYKHRLLFSVACTERGASEPVGMAFCITKNQHLYGRYWGAWQEVDSLHFETCYYTPITWAIHHGVQTFDPGAGGRHKKRRGFWATPNYSLHRFYTQRLGAILPEYIHQTNEYTAQEIQAINENIPLKAAPPTTQVAGMTLAVPADPAGEV
ncbi:MAG: GNAT family N-acetyltransferase [Gloeomargarita sp. DG02_1_bins_92]